MRHSFEQTLVCSFGCCVVASASVHCLTCGVVSGTQVGTDCMCTSPSAGTSRKRSSPPLGTAASWRFGDSVQSSTTQAIWLGRGLPQRILASTSRRTSNAQGGCTGMKWLRGSHLDGCGSLLRRWRWPCSFALSCAEVRFHASVFPTTGRAGRGHLPCGCSGPADPWTIRRKLMSGLSGAAASKVSRRRSATSRRSSEWRRYSWKRQTRQTG